MLKTKIVEYEQRLEAFNASLPGSEYSIGVEDIVQLEKEVLATRRKVAEMEGQIKGFEGLPPDRDAARREVKQLEKQVDSLKQERDRVFAEMVGE